VTNKCKKNIGHLEDSDDLFNTQNNTRWKYISINQRVGHLVQYEYLSLENKNFNQAPNLKEKKFVPRRIISDDTKSQMKWIWM